MAPVSVGLVWAMERRWSAAPELWATLPLLPASTVPTDPPDRGLTGVLFKGMLQKKVAHLHVARVDRKTIGLHECSTRRTTCSFQPAVLILNTDLAKLAVRACRLI